MPKGLPQIFKNLLFPGVYFAFPQVGLLSRVQPGNIALIWPPAGLSVAVLFWKPNLWPGILIGSFLADLTGEFSFGDSLLFALVNLFETLTCVFLLRRFHFSGFQRLRGYLYFWISAFTATLLAGTLLAFFFPLVIR